MPSSNIKSINLLYRQPEDGYAAQHGLLKGKNIALYFKRPNKNYVLEGTIKNTNNDSITIYLPVLKKTLFIDFKYEGIPEFLLNDGFQKIEVIDNLSTAIIGDKPETPETSEKEEETENIIGDKPETPKTPEKEEEEVIDDEIINVGEIEFENIEFGNVIEGAVYEFAGNEKQIRYSLDNQLNDMLGELLNNYTFEQRTPEVLKRIHTIVDRYRQLHNRNSINDKYGNIIGLTIPNITDQYKPIINYLKYPKPIEHYPKLSWISNVCMDSPIIYNSFDDSVVNDNNPDDNTLSPDSVLYSLKEYESYINEFNSNQPSTQNKFITLKNNTNLWQYSYMKNTNCMANKCMPFKYNDSIPVLLYSVKNKFNVELKDGIYKYYTKQLTPNPTYLNTVQSFSSTFNASKTHLVPDPVISQKGLLVLPWELIKRDYATSEIINLLEKVNNSTDTVNKGLYPNKLLYSDDKLPIKTVSLTQEQLNDKKQQVVDKLFTVPVFFTWNNKVDMTHELYDTFLNMIMPTTHSIAKKLLNTHQIPTLYNYYNIIQQLSVFHVFADDVVKQLGDLVNYSVYKNVFNYKKNLKLNREMHKSLIKEAMLKEKENHKKSNMENKNFIFNWIKNNNLKSELMKNYKYDNSDNNITLYLKMLRMDGGYNYTNALLLETKDLLNYNSGLNIIQNELDNVELSANANKCAKPVYITKNYNDIEVMELDNDMYPVWANVMNNTDTSLFNKLLDIVSKELGANEANESNEDESVITSIKKIIIPYMTESESKENEELKLNRFARNLYYKREIVNEGDYAILNDPINDTNTYYKRVNNKWKATHNPYLTGVYESDLEMLCMLQKDCMSETTANGDVKCMTTTELRKHIQKRFYQDTLDAFEVQYNDTIKQLLLKLTEAQLNSTRVLPILNALHKQYALKDDVFKYKIGINYVQDNGENIYSPYLELRDWVLGISDFSKKQNYILKFANNYTRLANKLSEDVNWLYCNKTSAKLIPVFFKELAITFVKNPDNYKTVLDGILQKHGKLSDDGDTWECFGFEIVNIQYDVEEGFEEGGFANKTRDVIHTEPNLMNLGFNVKQTSIAHTQNPEFKRIINIATSLSSNMGIKIEEQLEYIVTTVSIWMQKLITEKNYNISRQQHINKSQKDIGSYENYVGQNLLYTTFATFIIAVQSAIPTIKTKRTFPGCKSSFSGFPLTIDNDDYAFVDYVACIAHKIRSSIFPWVVLEKKKLDFIKQNIINTINKLLPHSEVSRIKLQDKNKEMLDNVENEINVVLEYELINWNTFLPPLQQMKIAPANVLVSPVDLIQNYSKNVTKKGSVKDLNALKITMIANSFAIIHTINTIVQKQPVLLQTAAGIPYVDNSCCSELVNNETTALSYFVSKSKEMPVYSNKVAVIQDYLNTLKNKIMPSMLKTGNNTKTNKFINKSALNVTLEAKIITFANYCNFNNIYDIPVSLKKFCNKKPSILFKDDIDTHEILMNIYNQDKAIYTDENYKQLMKQMAQEHIINTSYLLLREKGVNSNILKDEIELYLESLATKSQLCLDITAYSKLIGNLPEKNVNKKPVYNLMDFMKQSIDTNALLVQKRVSSYMSKKINVNVQVDALVDNWVISSSEYVPFLQNVLQTLGSIIPSLIKNNNNASYENVIISPYWVKIAENHRSKLNTYFKETLYIDNFDSYQSIANYFPYLMELNSIFVLIGERVPTLQLMKSLSKDTETHYYSLFFKYLLYSVIAVLISENALINNNENVDKHYKLMVTMIHKVLGEFVKEKKGINMTYETVNAKFNKLKSFEKFTVMDRLRDMSDEDRRSDIEMRKHKLGDVWNVGIQKGLLTYVESNFDHNAQMMANIQNMERKEMNMDDNAEFDELRAEADELDDINDEDNANLFDED
ncbi:hypothetical protein N8459_02755 [Nitrosopumilus sp.]|nr:hypothetical protein [Nitrosopumilus sp.]